MNRYTDEEENVQFSEPILAQKAVKCNIAFAEHTEWESKTNGLKNGKKFDACKLTVQIDDPSVKTEHSEAKPKLTIEHQFNIVQFPYEDKVTGETKMLGKQALYQLETAFGFDPVFKCDGAIVAPFITKFGNKVAPKIKDKEVKRCINPDFFGNYFKVVVNEDGTEKAIPNLENWVDKPVYCDIDVERSEQYGNKNVIKRYVKAPNA